MEDFFKKYNIEKEARISIVLNTFMYIDRCPEITDDRPVTLADAVSGLLCEKIVSKLNVSQRGALQVIREYLEKPENSDIAHLEILSYSNNMCNSYKGAYAAAFQTPDKKDVYIVYRGTGDGRWYDNGDALAHEYSRYQKTAEKYFNYVIKKLKPDDKTNIIVTGHSKGGNLAQYVTLVSSYKKYIKKCISFDGQGFSPEFLRSIGVDTDIARVSSINPAYVQLYIPVGIKQQISKMYSICGDNDYVNVLGIKIIPDSRTVYIATDCAVTDVVSSHSISPSYDTRHASGKISINKNKYFFNWDTNRFNKQTCKTRALSDILKNVSSYIMNESQQVREKDCHAVMDALEAIMSRRDKGLTGEDATLDEYMELIKSLPKIFFIAEATIVESMIPKKYKNIVKKQIKSVNEAMSVLKSIL